MLTDNELADLLERGLRGELSNEDYLAAVAEFEERMNVGLLTDNPETMKP